VTEEPRTEPGHGTPEGYTSEEPAAEELGQPGTPGAGMTPEAPHAADAESVEHGDAPADPSAGESAASVAHHDAATHMDAHTALSDDDHGHAEPVLGPVDWAAWSYTLIGVASAVIVVALFAFAISKGA
jgi:hypothetical protein